MVDMRILLYSRNMETMIIVKLSKKDWNSISPVNVTWNGPPT